MKKYIYIIWSLLGFFILACIFGPFLYVNSASLSIIQINEIYGFSSSNLVFYALFTLFLLMPILYIFIRNKKIVYSYVFIVSISSMFLCIFVCQIYADFLKDNVVEVGYVPVILGCVSGLLSLYSLSYLFEEWKLSIFDIVEIAIFVSFALVLDLPFFKVKIGSNGGSISLSMLPLLILSLRKGFAKGFFGCGIVFGLISCLIDGYGFASYPFDYLLGFGSLAIVGLFRKMLLVEKPNWNRYVMLIVAVTLSVSGRFFASTLSGILIYKLNFVASLIYQVPYILPSGGICIVAMCLLYRPVISISKRMSNKY